MRGETKQKTLTKAELRAMNILWDMEQATVNEIMERIPEPKPAYTTILTVMQVLTSKKIVGAQRRGKANVFRPLISREQYVDGFMEETRNTLFKGSFSKLLLFFAERERLAADEVEKIVALLKKNQQGTNNEEETNKN